MSTITAVKTELPEFITIARAAEALDTTPWKVVELVERGEIQAIRHDRRVLCRVYDVEQLGGVL